MDVKQEKTLLNRIESKTLLPKSQKLKPGGLDVETNRDPDRERP